MWESFIQFDESSTAPGEAVHKLITETRLQRPEGRRMLPDIHKASNTTGNIQRKIAYLPI
jgi:hypothetical protein